MSSNQIQFAGFLLTQFRAILQRPEGDDQLTTYAILGLKQVYLVVPPNDESVQTLQQLCSLLTEYSLNAQSLSTVPQVIMQCLFSALRSNKSFTEPVLGVNILMICG